MTKFDFAILGIMVVFTLLGFLRGFVTELFEAIGIIVAVLYGKLLAIKVAPILPDSVPEYMRVPISTFVLSILLIFTFKAIGSAIRKGFVKKKFKGTDHFLGGFMGAGKGVVLVICIMALLSLTPLMRLFEAEKKPAPVLRFAIKHSKPVLARYSQTIADAATKQIEEAVSGVATQNTAAVPATLDNLSSNLAPADRAAIVKLLKDPAISSLNMTEVELLKLVQAVRENQGGRAGK